MSLFVLNGRFVFLVHIGTHRLRIRSKDKYHDQQWHTVSKGLGSGGVSLVQASLPNHTQDTHAPMGAKGTVKPQPGLAEPPS